MEVHTVLRSRSLEGTFHEWHFVKDVEKILYIHPHKLVGYKHDSLADHSEAIHSVAV